MSASAAQPGCQGQQRSSPCQQSQYFAKMSHDCCLLFYRKVSLQRSFALYYHKRRQDASIVQVLQHLPKMLQKLRYPTNSNTLGEPES